MVVLLLSSTDMTVFASDGYDIVPFTTDALVVHQVWCMWPSVACWPCARRVCYPFVTSLQGETFDIAVTGVQANALKNWYIRIRTTEVYSTTYSYIDHEGWGVFRYAGAPVADPTSESQPRDCISQ